MEGFALGRVLATVVWCLPPTSTHSIGNHLSQGYGIKSTYVHINENVSIFNLYYHTHHVVILSRFPLSISWL